MSARIKVMSWDWREQPDLDELGRIIASLTDGIYLRYAETGSDQFALVVSTAPLNESEADEAYERWSGGNGDV